MTVFRKAAIAALFFFGLTACQGNGAYYGKGSISLSPYTKQLLVQYMNETNPSAFVVTPDGSRATYMYCPDVACSGNPMWEAVNHCKMRFKAEDCKVYAMRKQVVWRFDEFDQETRKEVMDILLEAKTKQLDTDWSGVLDDHPAIIEFDKGLKGSLSLDSENTGACSGHYTFSNIPDGNRYPGEWDLSCAKGQSATGQIVLTLEDGKKIQFISGFGKDNEGTNVRLYLTY